MKRNRRIGDMSIYEASDFWDEHDFTEFKDVKEVKEMRFALKKKKYIPAKPSKLAGFLMLTLTPDVNSGHEIFSCSSLPCIELPFIDRRG